MHVLYCGYWSILRYLTSPNAFWRANRQERPHAWLCGRNCTWTALPLSLESHTSALPGSTVPLAEGCFVAVTSYSSMANKIRWISVPGHLCISNDWYKRCVMEENVLIIHSWLPSWKGGSVNLLLLVNNQVCHWLRFLSNVNCVWLKLWWFCPPWEGFSHIHHLLWTHSS